MGKQNYLQVRFCFQATLTNFSLTFWLDAASQVLLHIGLSCFGKLVNPESFEAILYAKNFLFGSSTLTIINFPISEKT